MEPESAFRMGLLWRGWYDWFGRSTHDAPPRVLPQRVICCHASGIAPPSRGTANCAPKGFEVGSGAYVLRCRGGVEIGVESPRGLSPAGEGFQHRAPQMGNHGATVKPF